MVISAGGMLGPGFGGEHLVLEKLGVSQWVCGIPSETCWRGEVERICMSRNRAAVRGEGN